MGDLLETLSEEEEKVLRRYWPEGRPSGEGTNYFDEAMRMRLRRLRWKLRFETGGELVWLLGKLMGVITVGAVTWNALLG